MTAELATAFPEDSGYVAWVTAAFGPYWGFQEGFWSWCARRSRNYKHALQVMPMIVYSRLEMRRSRCAQAERGDGQFTVSCHVHVVPGRPRAVAEDRSPAHVRLITSVAASSDGSAVWSIFEYCRYAYIY